MSPCILLTYQVQVLVKSKKRLTISDVRLTERLTISDLKLVTREHERKLLNCVSTAMNTASPGLKLYIR